MKINTQKNQNKNMVPATTSVCVCVCMLLYSGFAQAAAYTIHANQKKKFQYFEHKSIPDL